MSVVKKAGRAKPYTFTISTGKKLANGKYELIFGPYFATKKEAQEAEATAKAQITLNTYVAPSRMTVGELAETFMKTKVDIRDSSITSIRSFVNRIKRHPLGEMQLSKVTLYHVELFRAYLFKETKLANQTIRETLSFLRSSFEWAVNTDMIPKNPAKKIKLPPKEPPKGMHVPMPILLQILSIIKAFDYYNLYMPFLMGGMCGMRVSETLAVKLNVLDSDSINITNNLLRVSGKLNLAPTKTRTSVRDVPILAYVRREIQEYIKCIELARLAALAKRQELTASTSIISAKSDLPWKNTLGLLIVFPDDGRPMSKDHVERRWRRLKAKCPEWLALVDKYPLLTNMRHHDFRHSFGSNLRDKGVPIADISDILGHCDVSFTAKTYALPLEDTHKNAMKLFEEKISDMLK